jgi:predicted O-methyltransferase YrrM
MDGHPLPSRARFLQNLARFPSLRVKLIPGDSGAAATVFQDASVDFVFIDGCHASAAVLRDIDTWIPKITSGGTIAGDDYDWEEVRRAVHQRFSDLEVTRSGTIWWRRI